MNPCIFINRLSPTSQRIYFCPSSLDRPEQSNQKLPVFSAGITYPFVFPSFLGPGTKDICFEQYRKCSNNNNNRPFFLNQVFYLDIILRLPFPSCKPIHFSRLRKFSPKRGYVQTRIHRRLHDAVQELHDEVGNCWSLGVLLKGVRLGRDPGV